MKRRKPIALTEDQRAIAIACVEITTEAVGVLGAQGETVNGLMKPLVGYERWLAGQSDDQAVREAADDALGLRQALANAVATHPYGLARVDASVRATIAWMVWRVGAFILG